MDILKLLTSLSTDSLVSSDTISKVSKATNSTEEETKGVVDTALPMLLQSVLGNSSSSKSDLLTNLLSNLSSKDDEEQKDEEEQGNSILTTLLGSDKNNFLNKIAKKLGLSTAQVTSILVAIAPIALKQISSLISTDTSSKSSSEKKSTTTKKSTSTTKSSSSSSSKKTTSTKKSEETDATDLISDVASAVLSNLLKK
ncbi:MAG: DUF937 domain-containing protein [Erysipelotrichaceae bacterium]